MNLDWTKHISDPAKQKSFQDTLRNSSLIIDRLRDILKEYEAEIDKGETNLSAYDTPSWPYKQAHLNGRRQEIRRILNLLTLTKDNNDR